MRTILPRQSLAGILAAAVLAFQCADAPGQFIGGPGTPAPIRPEGGITHGPILGRPGATEMGIWARTEKPGQFYVRYATGNEGDMVSDKVVTGLETDNTG